MTAAVAWLTGGAGYTLHNLRGGNDFARDRGHAANLWAVANIRETFCRLREAADRLPSNLPNCRPANAHWADAPFSVDPDTLVRAYQSVYPDGTLVLLPHGIKVAAAELVARRPVTIDGRTYHVGDMLAVPAPSAIIVGRIH